MTGYHEPVQLLNEKDKNIVRALNSLKEEIEAIDWYNQRVVTSQDQELKDEELRTYLFKDGSITDLEEKEND